MSQKVIDVLTILMLQYIALTMNLKMLLEPVSLLVFVIVFIVMQTLITILVEEMSKRWE